MKCVTSLLILSMLAVGSLAHIVAPHVVFMDNSFDDVKREVVKDMSLSARWLTEMVQSVEGEAPTQAENIPGVVKQLGLTVLLDLVVKAGLAPTLSGDGPFTVFGPTNTAFKDMPEWAKKAVANKTILTEILTFHVLPGKVMSTDLKNELVAKTASGKPMRINLYKKPSGTVATAQCAPIDLTKVDNDASNGVVHELSAVAIPPSGDIVSTLVECPVYKTLVAAVTKAKLASTLSGPGPFTLFAPSDSAFKKLPAGTLDKLLKDVTKLTKVLLYHVVEGTVCSSGLVEGKVGTVEKQDVTIVIGSDGVKVNDAKVIVADGSVTNGVIHGIDTVLIPPDLEL